MKQLSERALHFIEKSGRNKEYKIDSKIIEEHLKLYNLQNTSCIIRFHEMFSGLNFQNIVIHIFTPKQIEENKGVNTYHWKGQTLFSINDSLYIAENGEIAIKHCYRDSCNFYFYYESFGTFIEEQAFFEKYQYYKNLHAVVYEITDVKEFSKSLSDYNFLNECSDKYNLVWKNEVNFIHARDCSEIWEVVFDSVSEEHRYDLIDKLKEKHLII
jgi:hypothetical protein